MELDKKQLRKQLIQMRLAFDDYQKQSHFIIEKLKKDPRFIKSKKIGIYLSYKHEVDTWKLIEEFKTHLENGEYDKRNKKNCSADINDYSDIIYFSRKDGIK